MKTFRTLLVGACSIGCAVTGPGTGDDAGQVVSQLVSGAGEATLALTSSWGSGYCAEVSVANKGTSPITSWSVTLDFKGANVGNLWNGSRNGNVVTPVDHNKSIGVGAKVGFGFCASTSSAAQLPPLVAALNVTGGSSTTPTNPTGPTNPTTPTTPTDPSAQPYPPITSGCAGYATRFWDCCKPHCGWAGNVPSGVTPIDSCTKSNAPQSNVNAQSSCSGGDAHMCYGLAPVAISEKLAYGYAATSSGDVCGRCYQLDFDGTSRNAGNDPGSKALAGKTMVVQAINVGYDVGGGQFDLLVPGGGVGAFNACSAQWGVSNAELGAQYGGFLSACKQQLGYSASLSAYKSCVSQKCASVFQSRGLTDLAAGCNWFVDWFQAADNPSLRYKEVTCPRELTSESGMNRAARNDISRACGN